MPTIKGYQLPDEVVHYIQSMIDEFPARVVWDLATNYNLIKGFRLIPKNTPQIRDRIKAHIASQSEFDEFLRDTLKIFCKVCDFTLYLSEGAIKAGFDDFLGYFGRAPFLTALLLDERESILIAAKKYIEEHKEPEPEKPDAKLDAATEILRELDPFLTMIDDIRYELVREEHYDNFDYDEDDREVGKGVQKKIKKLEKAIAALKKELEKTKEYKEKLKGKLEEQKKYSVAEKGKLEQEIKKAKEEIRDLRLQMRTGEETKKELEQSFDKRLRERVNEELNAVTMKWLRKPLRFEKTVQDALSLHGALQDLLARAESVLKYQAEQDKHYGNRALLEKQRKDMEDILERIQMARKESMSPLPELRILAEELGMRIEELRRKLNVPPEINSFVEALKQRINDAEPDEIPALRGLIMDAAEIGGITKPEERRLYECCNDKVERIYAAHTEGRIAKKMPEHALSRLTWAVKQNRQYVLCLDGYNILFLLKEIFEPYYENGIPDRIARERLTEIMTKTLRTCPQVLARVYYDSPEASLERKSENVTVIYSGGQRSEHRADNAILKDLKAHPAKDNEPRVCVVTDDRELRKKAGENGASHMSVEELAIFLDDYEEVCKGSAT